MVDGRWEMGKTPPTTYDLPPTRREVRPHAPLFSNEAANA